MPFKMDRQSAHTTIPKKINSLYADFQMFLDGSWQPDNRSVEASQDVLLSIVDDLKKAGVIDNAFEPHIETKEKHQ